MACPGSPGPLSPHPASSVPVGLPGGSWVPSRPLFRTLILGRRACPGQQGLLPPLYLQRPCLHSRSGPWMPADELWGHQSRRQAPVHGAITRNITPAIRAAPVKHRSVFTRSLQGRRPEAGAVGTGRRSRNQRAVPTVPPAQVPVHAPPQGFTPSESAEPSLPSSLRFSFLSNSVCSRAPLVGLWESLEGPTVQNRRGY